MILTADEMYLLDHLGKIEHDNGKAEKCFYYYEEIGGKQYFVLALWERTPEEATCHEYQVYTFKQLETYKGARLRYSIPSGKLRLYGRVQMQCRRL